MLTDVDIIFESNYISQAVRELKSNPYKIIRCVTRDSNEGDISEATDIIKEYQDLKSKTVFRHATYQRASKEDFGKGILFVLTDFLHRIGGLDENYKIWGKEDDDVVKRLEMIGLHSFIMEDQTSYIHQWHPKFEGVAEEDKSLIEKNAQYYHSTHTILRNKNPWERFNI